MAVVVVVLTSGGMTRDETLPSFGMGDVGGLVSDRVGGAGGES